MLRLPLALLALAPPLAAVAAAPITLQVMCYNIHHAEGLDGKVDVERIARLITDHRADVVALQEVDRGVERTQRRDLPAELAKLTGLTVRFDRNIPHQGGDYGTAVLTRFPLKSARHTQLPMVGAGEQRGVQQLVLDVHGREVLVLNTHLDHRREPAEREAGVAAIRRIVDAAGAMPVIVCGDFNATPESVALTRMREILTDSWAAVGQGPGYTIPVRNPNRRIDYIWVSAATIEPVRMRVLRSEASDHLPILAELRLR